MSELYKFIGEKIRKLRQDYSGVTLSQEDLANKIGVPTNTISRWETATYKVSAEDLQKLAKTFSIDISVFFPETEQSKLTPSLQALMSATSDLTEEDIAELTEYAKFRKARQILNANKSRKSK
jgi:transcriptional regulator with XRE-family HTH domain